jgi:hypothetical protein
MNFFVKKNKEKLFLAWPISGHAIFIMVLTG